MAWLISRALMDSFAECFNLTDHLVLTDIYLASEKPIEGITTQVLLEKVREKRPANLTYLQKENILYVGDTIGDIEASRKAGIRVAAVTWGYNTKESLEAAKPDFLISQPEELLNIIKTAS